MKITKLLTAAALAGAAIVAPSFASAQTATNFSFTGNLTDANQVLRFDFSTLGGSTVELRSYSYAGGTNAQGTVIARGGFDPELALYNAAGNLIFSQDDGGSSLPADAVTGRRYDVDFTQALAAGNYSVLLTVYPKSCGATLAVGCSGTGNYTDVTGNLRDSHFAFDVLGATGATGPGGAVPEPASWAMLILGMGAVGYAMRRRQKVRVAYAA